VFNLSCDILYGTRILGRPHNVQRLLSLSCEKSCGYLNFIIAMDQDSMFLKTDYHAARIGFGAFEEPKK
jgi:hypothetical protein